MGYGTTNMGLTSFLNKVELVTVNTTTCQEGHENIITDNMLCVTSIQEEIAGMCQGDSGSAFVIAGKVVGVSSWGVDCGLPEYPGVLTRVEPFLDWIDEISNL